MSRSAFSGGYTDSEAALLNILKEFGGDPVDSLSLVNMFYVNKKKPVNASRSIVSILNRTIPKVDRYGESFRLRKTSRRGPRPIEFWIEKRRKKAV